MTYKKEERLTSSVGSCASCITQSCEDDHGWSVDEGECVGDEIGSVVRSCDEGKPSGRKDVEGAEGAWASLAVEAIVGHDHSNGAGSI